MTEPTEPTASQTDRPSDESTTPPEPTAQPAPPQPTADRVDLAAVERDLDGVERALQRLDDGTYWSDEATGAPIPDEVLAADPVARRAE